MCARRIYAHIVATLAVMGLLALPGCSATAAPNSGATSNDPNSTLSSTTASSALVVAVDGMGEAALFTRRADTQIWYTLQPCVSCKWNAWTSLSGQATSDPAVATAKDGGFAVFVRGNDGGLWYREQSCAGCVWSSWADLGGQVVGTPVATATAAGVLQVFVRGTDGKLWRIARTCPACITWGKWTSMQVGVP